MRKINRCLAGALAALIVLLSPGSAGFAAAAEIVGPEIETPAAREPLAALPAALPAAALPSLAAVDPLSAPAAVPTLPEAAVSAANAPAPVLAAGQALGQRLAAVEAHAPGAAAQSEEVIRQVMDGARNASVLADRTSAVSAGAGAVAVAVAKGVGILTASKAAAFGLLPAALWLGGRALVRRRAMPAFKASAEEPNAEERGPQFLRMFGAESQANLGARLMRWAAFAAMDTAGMLALHHFKADPAAGAVFVLAAAIGWYALRQTKSLDKAVHLLRAALYGRLREGKPQRALDSIPGATGLEKHVGYFGGGKTRVQIADTFRSLRATGEAVHTAAITSLAAHLTMSGKTQKGLTAAEKRALRLRRWDIYLPNIGRALMPSDSGAFAVSDLPDGTKRGDVDPAKFERIFRDFAGGRDYVTARDLARLEQANYARDAGKAPFLKRLIGKIQSKRSFDQMLAQLADRVVYEPESGKLVPAISRPQLLWLYQGRAMYDLMQERTGKDVLAKRPE